MNFLRRWKRDPQTLSITKVGQRAIFWPAPELDFELVEIQTTTNADGIYSLYCKFESVGRYKITM
jgi:hypothetical protein